MGLTEPDTDGQNNPKRKGGPSKVGNEEKKARSVGNEKQSPCAAQPAFERPDRGWMLRRIDDTGLVSEEFKDGVDEFLALVEEHPEIFDSKDRILCPCKKCKLTHWKEPFNVSKDLYYNGFSLNYINWTFHGEASWGDYTSFGVYESSNTSSVASSSFSTVDGPSRSPAHGEEEDFAVTVQRAFLDSLVDGPVKDKFFSIICEAVKSVLSPFMSQCATATGAGDDATKPSRHYKAPSVPANDLD